MKLERFFTGGTYSFCPVEGGDGEVPCFVFEASDAGAVERALQAMYVEPSVRFDTSGELAYCLTIPDRDLRPWAIPVRREDLARLAAAAATARSCPTLIACGERIFDLQPFTKALTHDWSGGVARAILAFGRNDLAQAMEELKAIAAGHPDSIPSAHHLLGRCFRSLDRLEEATACYRRAVRAAVDSEGRLVPFAAGPLSDLGVAFKRMGDTARAVHCFLHSLHLRPNHPEALLTFFSLFPTDEKLVLYGAARVLAIGGRDELVGSFLFNYGSARGRDLGVLLALARQMSLELDLLEWPLDNPKFASHEEFEKRLEDGPPPDEGAPPATGTLN
jgi:tetratricopeptide (TPR) repeat protein